MIDNKTTRSIGQLLRRHGPESLIYIDEYDVIARVSRFRADADVRVNRRRLHRRVTDRMKSWQDDGGYVFGAVPDKIEEKDLAPMQPRQVEWKPFGQWYACKRRETCGVMHKDTDAGFDGRCRLCQGPLGQLPYVFYHDCGSIAELTPAQRDACPNPQHGMRFMAFIDLHDLTKSYWQCRQCSHRSSTLFYPPCRLQVCRSRKQDHKNYQISHWRDQWVYYSQNVDYVNLDDAQAIPFVKSPAGRELVHASVLGQVATGRRRLAGMLETAGGNCSKCGTKVTPGWNLCPNCGQQLPKMNTTHAEIPIDVDDGRVTWAVLRDLEESVSLREQVADPETHSSKTTGFEMMQRNGIYDVVLVKEFPLTTALIGYTRNRSDNQSWLRLFLDHDNKLQVYTDSNKTEGLMVQLSAKAIVEWLRENDIYATDGALPDGDDEDALKTWLVEKIAAADENIVPAVYPLLHSYAHVFLYSMAVCAGLEPSSLGELIMLDALGFAIYAGDSELGALTATFDQMLDAVVDGTAQFRTCKMDPGCRDDDKGACVGCIHLPRGCVRFNDELSRAYLFGGSVSATRPHLRGFLRVAATL